MNDFVVGAQLYSVRNLCSDPAEMDNALKRLHDAGYRTCQSSGVNWEKIPPEKQRELFDRNGLECICTHVSFYDLENKFEEMVDAHRKLGCRYVGIGMMPEEFRYGTEGVLAFAARADRVADRLAKEGMVFIYHNHNFEFRRFADSGKNAMELLLENVHSPAFQFEPDVFWIQAGGADPVEWLYRLNGKTDVVHFKEMNGGDAKLVPLIAPIGDGNMDWGRVIRACRETGVRYAMVEQDNAPDSGDAVGCLIRSHDYLATLHAKF